eukprot:437865-Pelagomonas_calceolata.AAC.1
MGFDLKLGSLAGTSVWAWLELSTGERSETGQMHCACDLVPDTDLKQTNKTYRFISELVEFFRALQLEQLSRPSSQTTWLKVNPIVTIAFDTPLNQNKGDSMQERAVLQGF